MGNAAPRPAWPMARGTRPVTAGKPTPADLSVPADWDVPNAGATGSSNIVSIEFQVASQADDVSFNFCISNVSVT